MSKKTKAKNLKQKKFRDGIVGLLLLAIIMMSGTFAWSGVRNMAFNPLYDLNFGGRLHDHFAPVSLNTGHGPGSHHQLVFAENFGSEYIFVRARLREFASEDGVPLIPTMEFSNPMTWPIYMAEDNNVNTRRAGTPTATLAAGNRVNLTLGEREQRHVFMPTFNRADRMATGGVASIVPTRYHQTNAFQMSEALGNAIDGIAGGNTLGNTSINHADITDVTEFIEAGLQTGPGLLGFNNLESSVEQGRFRYFTVGQTMTGPRLVVSPTGQLTLDTNNGNLHTHTAQETLAPGPVSVMTFQQWNTLGRPTPSYTQEDVLINNFWVMDTREGQGWFYFAAPLPPGEGTSLLANALNFQNINNRTVEYILHIDMEFTTQERLDAGLDWTDRPGDIDVIWDIDDEEGSNDDDEPSQYIITLYPSRLELIPGTTHQFMTNRISREISEDTVLVWSIDGEVHSETYITEDGLLIIHDDENALQFNVVATDSDGNVGMANVTSLWNEYGLLVYPYHMILAEDDVFNGTEYQFTASLYNYLTSETTIMNDVEWSISGNSSTGTYIRPDGVLVIGLDETESIEVIAEAIGLESVSLVELVFEENLSNNPILSLPGFSEVEIHIGCDQNGAPGTANARNVFVDKTGVEWCAVSTQNRNGNQYTMLIARNVHDLSSIGGNINNALMPNSAPAAPYNTLSWGGAVNPTTANPAGPIGRRNLNTWFRSEENVSSELRERVTHATLPIVDSGQNVTAWRNRMNDRRVGLSQPIHGEFVSSDENGVFLLSVTEANVLLGLYPESRIGMLHDLNVPAMGAPYASYWLRSPGANVDVTSVNSVGAFSDSAHSRFSNRVNGLLNGPMYRPAIWVSDAYIETIEP